MSLFQLLIIYVTINILQKDQTLPCVQINNSQIIGQQISFYGHKVNQYLGIPYAIPPVGQLRFKKPIPVQNYAPVLLASTNPPACLQYSTKPYPWYIKSTEKSEDCLYLNIWTPDGASPTNKKAVLFWVHGGSYRYGSIRSELYSGIPLSTLGDIIVVTVNYRLGPFGFLTSGTEDAPLNVGLWDILEGLKWVNQHIGAFGGDVQRITISGESAGANAVGLLTISPLAKGLYTRIIMQSGSPLNHPNDSNKINMVISQQIAKQVGCANDTYPIAIHPKEVVQCLRELDADTLIETVFEVDFRPQWGDELLPDEPLSAVKEGNFECKDLLVGNNKDEASYIITTSDPEVYGFYGEKNDYFNITLGKDLLNKVIGSFPGSQAILQYYLPDDIRKQGHSWIRHQTYTGMGDLINICPSEYYAEKCAEQNENVYFYFFAHRPSVTPWPEWMGVAHFDEVQFVFGQPILHPEKYQPSEVSLSQQMIDIWSHFVKNGKPNIPWPLYSKENPAFKYLGPENVTEKNDIGPHLKNCNFLRQFFLTH